MKNEYSKRATFLTIERPLTPTPPKEAKPEWYYINTLGFYHDNKKVWEQKIPEAKMSWTKTNRTEDTWDVFEKYGHCEVFYKEGFGWQLKWTITHERAKKWHKKILSNIEYEHKKHFKTKK